MEMKRKHKISGAVQIRQIAKAEVTIPKQKARRLHLVRNIFFAGFIFKRIFQHEKILSFFWHF
jgi:hypothetical protein